MKRATLQSEHVVTQLKIIDGHASRNVLKRRQSMIEGTSSLSFQSSPNSTHNPSPMYEETYGMSSRLVTPPPIPTFEHPMTKSEMLQSQSKSMATIVNNLEANVEDREAMLRAKVDVSIEKKVFNIGNLRVARKCGVITDEEFKIKVKELLDL
jgi:hypothetical protein